MLPNTRRTACPLVRRFEAPGPLVVGNLQDLRIQKPHENNYLLVPFASEVRIK
jgi:hypothetical protein